MSNQFLRHNAIFFVGSMGVAFLNYLYYPVMGRLLSNEAFGELQVVVSTFMQMTTVLTVLSIIVVAILVNERDKELAKSTALELEKVAFAVGMVVLILLTVFAGQIQQALKFESFWPFIVMGLIFIVSVPQTFRNAYMRAEKDFTNASISSALGSISKILFSVLFVVLSFMALGAVMGILASQIVTVLYLNHLVKKKGYSGKFFDRHLNLRLVRPQLPYAGFVLVVSLLTTLQISIDVTLVKYFFDPAEAGDYAAIATVARIIFFLSGSIVAVLLSSVSAQKTIAENSAVLVRSIILVVGLGGTATVFFSLFPRFVVHLLLGARYDGSAHLLPLLSLTIFVASLVTLIATYHISLKSYLIAPIVVTGSAFTFILTSFNHAQPGDVVVNILSGSLCMLVGLAVYTIITAKRAVS
jgi:O-antigen/teichoic acid export membrane protein